MDNIDFRLVLKAAEPAQEFAAVRVSRKSIDVRYLCCHLDGYSEDAHRSRAVEQRSPERSGRLETDEANRIL